MLVLCSLSFSFLSYGEELGTLRGGVAIDQEVPAENKDAVIIGRDANPEIFNQHEVEPRMIPHSIEGYEVTAKQNMCLMCHEAGISGATKVPESHFVDERTGEKTDKVDDRRYFCTQCHMSQKDTEPLVKNHRDD